MRQIVIMIMLALGLAVTSGCNDNPRFKFHLYNSYVTINTIPDGATVYQINPPAYSRTLLGETPIIEQPVLVTKDIYQAKNLSLEMMQELSKSVGNIKVTIQKEGYKTYTGFLKAAPDKTNEHTITLKPVE